MTRIVRRPREWWNARAPFVIACAFAGGFLTLRLLYRLVFGGWPGDINAWFAVARGVLASGVPFVFVVVIFGALNTLIDFPALLARWAGRGVGRNVRLAVGISLASYPELVASSRTVRLARRLRGDRSIRSLIIPLLERSVERGVSSGIALDQRGFGMRSHPDFGMCDAPVVARDVSFGFDSHSGAHWSITIGDLLITPGSCVLITGATGSGKTALLHALSGRLLAESGAWQDGVLEVGGFDRRLTPACETAGFVSMVEQNVRHSFIASTVYDEIAFTLRMRGDSAASITSATAGIAQRLHIDDLLTRTTSSLSAGEATLVALAAALVTRPSLLLLDEPIADLDDANACRVVAALRELHETTGMTMVIAEHRWTEVERIADRRVHLGDPAIPHGDVPQPLGPALTSGVRALVAPNGAGKTTWLTSFAKNHPEHVRLVPEDAGLLFSHQLVSRECSHNDRLGALPEGTTLALAKRLIPQLSPDAHPRDLSTGERLALACALQAAVRPSLLLLDEPTRGLDASARAQLREVLSELACEGTHVIFATHDREFAAACDSERFRITPSEVRA